jgi:hypothetical protein
MGHQEALRAEFPEIANRVFLLSEMVGQRKDVRDPIGRPLPEYRDTLNEIERILDQGLDKIRKLSQDCPTTHDSTTTR